MTQIICLANSIRPDGRCIAGIDMDTGRWIRPVPRGGGGISSGRTSISGEQLSSLDVVELEISPPRFDTRFQCENREVLNWDWKVIGRMTPDDILRYCDKTAPILHSNDDRVELEVLEQLSPDQWTSLQLIRAKPVTFIRDRWERNRWRAHFADSAGNPYHLKTTDPVISEKLEKGPLPRNLWVDAWGYNL